MDINKSGSLGRKAMGQLKRAFSKQQQEATTSVKGEVDKTVKKEGATPSSRTRSLSLSDTLSTSNRSRSRSLGEAGLKSLFTEPQKEVSEEKQTDPRMLEAPPKRSRPSRSVGREGLQRIFQKPQDKALRKTDGFRRAVQEFKNDKNRGGWGGRDMNAAISKLEDAINRYEQGGLDFKEYKKSVSNTIKNIEMAAKNDSAWDGLHGVKQLLKEHNLSLDTINSDLIEGWTSIQDTDTAYQLFSNLDNEAQKVVLNASEDAQQDVATLSKPTATLDKDPLFSAYSGLEVSSGSSSELQTLKESESLTSGLSEIQGKNKTEYQTMVSRFAHDISANTANTMREVKTDQLHTEPWNPKKPEKQDPAVMKLIDDFNKLSLFVQSDVTSASTPKKAAKRMEVWIDLATQLLEQGDYHNSMSIFSGTQDSSVNRLKKTKAKLTRSHQKKLRSLQQQLDLKKNFAVLRQTTARSQKSGNPTIPYFGLVSKDFTAIGEINDTVQSGPLTGAINPQKVSQGLVLENDFEKNVATLGESSSFLLPEELRMPLFNHDYTPKTTYQQSLTLEPRKK